MTTLAPLQTLYTLERGAPLPLPPELAALYGRLDFPPHPGRPYLFGNFVSTLDGVVALNMPGTITGGGEISGFNQHDRMVMGLLRAVADAVIVGAGTLRAAPRHRWTAEHVYPPLADAYRQLRASLGKAEPPLNVFVTARGDLDLSQPVFQSGDVPVLIVTTPAGAAHLDAPALPGWVQLTSVAAPGPIRASAVLEATQRVRPCELILTEGGPKLMSDFFAERLLDELFLTLAPQVAGRDLSIARPGFVDGRLFAPDQPIWGRLISVLRGAHHLFLRYAFDHTQASS